MSNASKKKALAMKKAGKGIFAPKKLSDALAAICGKKSAPRTEVGPAQTLNEHVKFFEEI